jgi:protein TonB
MSSQTAPNDVLSYTAFISVAIHAVVILGVTFKLPDLAKLENTDNTLDVVLINQSNNERDENAQTVSTNDNAGGGTQDKEAESPLPFKPVDPSPIDAVTKSAQAETKAVQETKLLSGDAIKIAKTLVSEQKLENRNEEKGSDLLTTKSKRQLERERLIAKITQSQVEYQKRPKRTFLSPSTKQHDAAKYLNEWRQQVEHVGNANYPEQARQKNLSGSLVVDVAINPNGTINAIKVLTPSKHKLLNDAALRIIRDSAPFKSFPDVLRKNTDILHITRAFHFLGDNRLTSSDASSQR